MYPKQTLAESLLFIILIVFTGYAFSFGLDGIFLLDDSKNIGGAIIESFDLKQLFQIISSNTSGTLGRPLSVLSFSLTGLAHTDHVWGFKYHNILIHLLIGIVIYCLCKRLLNLFDEHPARNYKIALFTTAVWLLHPMQVSTVMYAVQRMTQLSALFSFLAILVFLRAVQSPNNKVKIWHYFVLFPLTCLASVLSKENGVLIPIFVGILALAIYFSSSLATTKIKHRLKRNRYDKVFISVFVLLPLAIGALGFAAKFESFTDYSARPFTMQQRLMSQIDFVFLYLNQLALPRLSVMGLFFDDIPIPAQMNVSRVGKLFVLIALLLGGLIALLRGKSILGLGVVFFFCGHLLESTIIPLELAFEHRNYLPSFGVFLVICYFLITLSQKYKPTLFVTVVWFAMLLTLLFLRLHYWSDGSEWQRTTLAYHPKSERTQLEYIHTLAQTQKPKVVIEQIDKARMLIPDRLSLPINRLLHSCQVDSPHDNLDIIKTIQEMVLSQPLTTIAFNSLGELVNAVLYKKCRSVSKVQVYVFVGMAIEKQTLANSKSSRLAYLNALKAKMEVNLGNYELAYSLYREAFDLTGQVDFLFWAISVLLLVEDTREKGYSEVQALENNKYFYAAPHQYRIDKLKKKIADNNYTFAF